MINRLKQLSAKVQKRVYEMAGMTGTICSDDTVKDDPDDTKLDRGHTESEEYNQAMTAFLFATPEEMQDFLSYYKRCPVHKSGHAINWNGLIRSDRREYNKYLRSDEWNRKRQAVLNRAMRPFIIEPIIVHRTRDRYGRLIELIKTEWKTVCESHDCSNIAEHVHHHNYDRIGKERIGMKPEASEENDLIALCKQCHATHHSSLFNFIKK